MDTTLVIVGEGSVAEAAYEYFTHDSDYEVVASIEQHVRTKDNIFEVPVVLFESLEYLFDPMEHDVFAAIGFLQLNRLRTRLCAEAKKWLSLCELYQQQSICVAQRPAWGELLYL